MSLTLQKEQSLAKVSLVGLYESDATRWNAFAQKSYDLAVDKFPNGTQVRRDDVAKFLVPLLEVDPKLQDYLAAKRVKQKYYYGYFGDLVIDRCWQTIAGAGQGAQATAGGQP